MATASTVTRTLRDGAIVLKDGTATPKSITIQCDEGNLTWTVDPGQAVKMCRGSISGMVKANDVACTGSFTAEWTQLIAASGATNELYEMLTDYAQSVFTSTSTTSGAYTLDIEFTVVDPSDPDNANGTGELITFADASCTVTASEGGEKNTIAVSFTIPAVKPTVARIAAA